MRLFNPVLALFLSLCACENGRSPEPPPMPPPASVDAEGLLVTLTSPAAFERGQAPIVEFTVTNPTQSPKSFCIYHTPFEGMRNDIFRITADDRELPYQGMMAKRGAPAPDDYVRLVPGASKSSRIDVSEGYALSPGTYQLRYRGTRISGLQDSAPISITMAP